MGKTLSQDIFEYSEGSCSTLQLFGAVLLAGTNEKLERKKKPYKVGLGTEMSILIFEISQCIPGDLEGHTYVKGYALFQRRLKKATIFYLRLHMGPHTNRK